MNEGTLQKTVRGVRRAGTPASLPGTMARYKDVWQRQSETDNPPLPHAAGPLHGGSKRLFIAETNEEASHPLKLFTYDVMPRFT